MPRRLLFLVACTLLSLPVFSSSESDASAPASVRIAGLDTTSSRHAEAERVLARFADVGLELPSVVIEFHEAAAACHGHDGFIRYADPIPTISICSDRPYVLPHELAHAWVDANVSPEAKTAYVETWGLSSWDDPDDDWNDRGTEHAAFTIQQNLMANPQRMTRTWQERADAFEAITGQPSPLRQNQVAAVQ